MYPGTLPPCFSMTPPLACQRVDRSGGRYDWTLVPQHLNTNRLHYPFILRPDKGADLPEFQILTSTPRVWEPVHLGLTKGRISSGYLQLLSERAAALENSRIGALPHIPTVPDQDWTYIKTLVNTHPTPDEISRF